MVNIHAYLEVGALAPDAGERTDRFIQDGAPSRHRSIYGPRDRSPAPIAEEFGLSDSKTTCGFGRMADGGTVGNLRLGRESLVALIDSVPTSGSR